MAEYLTELGFGGYAVIQDTDEYAFSQDSVLLANTARIGPKDRVLDLGCGSGILATLALAKKGAKSAVGVELNEKLCDMARRSATLNGLALEIVNCDVKNVRIHIKAESFDKVLLNPPYYSAQSKLATTGSTARAESSATLADFIFAAGYALRFGGDVWCVVKISRLAELFSAFERAGLAPKEMTLVYPKLSAGVDVVIVSAKKGAKSGLVTKTFIAQNEDGSFTKEYNRLYSTDATVNATKRV